MIHHRSNVFTLLEQLLKSSPHWCVQVQQRLSNPNLFNVRKEHVYISAYCLLSVGFDFKGMFNIFILLCCRELDGKIGTILMSACEVWS